MIGRRPAPVHNPDSSEEGRGRGPLSLQGRALIGVTMVAAGAGLIISARMLRPITGESLELSLLLLGMTVLAWNYPVRFAPKMKIRVTQIAVFAAVLLLPVFLAGAVTMLGVTIGETLRHTSLRQRVFNVAKQTLGALAAGSVLYALSAETFVSRPSIQTGVPVTLAVLVDYLVGAILVVTMISVQTRRNAFTTWRDSWRSVLPQDATLYLLAVFAALIGHVQPWALLVVTAPAFVVYRSLRDGVALRTQTRDAVEQLADIVDMRDRYTYEHSRRVADLSKALALRIGLSGEAAQEIYMAARVHDVGKIGIRSTTLLKETAMADDEWAEMRTHPDVGAQLISRFPDFAAGRDVVLHHHERWDGKGYPHGIAGTRIPLGARVIAVTDTFDAMTSHRAYRKALPIDAVFAELQRCRGTQFEPRILDAFLVFLREQPEYIARTESIAVRPRDTGPSRTAAAGAG